MDAPAQVPKDNGRDEEMLRLAQQISELGSELKRQAFRWCEAHSDLQNQIDILTKQNQELHEDLKALVQQCLEATKKPAASLPTAGAPSTQPANIRMERIDSGEITKEDKDEAPSRSLQDRSAMSTGGMCPLEERLSGDGKVIHQSSQVLQKPSARKSSLPASATMLQEVEFTAREKDLCSSYPVSSEDELLVQAAKELQNLPRPSPEAVDSKDARTEEETWEKRHPSGKVEQVLDDGRTIITFPNGTRKEVSADKKTTLIRFFNGDVKKIKADQRVIYYYADAHTTHTIYPDGVETVQFPNKWTEKFYPDGSKETMFPDGTVKWLKDGCEETVFPDGTTVTVKREYELKHWLSRAVPHNDILLNFKDDGGHIGYIIRNGDKTIVFSNGQKEIHTAEFKRREFPDGTSKTVYCNGCQETKYASGRVRVKDETGNVILDWR